MGWNMEIVARYSFSSVEVKLLNALRSYGVEVDVGPLISVATVPEQSTFFKDLHSEMLTLGAVYSPETSFSNTEINQAQLLKISPKWYLGYPQPEDGFGYRRTTYNESSWCSVCFVGARQVAPFKLRTLPKWGNRSAFALNWVHDEIFVRSPIFQEILSAFHVLHREVLGPKSERLNDVVQLDIPIVGELGSDRELEKCEPCQNCGKVKYSPLIKGRFPNFRAESSHAIYKIDAWFGSGGDARRPIIVRADLAKAIRRLRTRGFECVPVSEH